MQGGGRPSKEKAEIAGRSHAGLRDHMTKQSLTNSANLTLEIFRINLCTIHLPHAIDNLLVDPSIPCYQISEET